MHQTNLTIENPSATVPLKLYTQALSREEAGDVEYVWQDDPSRMWLAPKGRESFELTNGRRFVLVAHPGEVSRVGKELTAVPHVTVLLHGSRSIRTTNLTLDKDGDWIETKGETITRGKHVELKLSATHRIALKIGNEEDCESHCYLSNLSSCAVQIVRQVVGRERVTMPQAATWIAPIEAGVIAAGGKKSVQVNDHQRVIIESNSTEPVELGFGNSNPIHSMRLKTLSKDNGEANVAIIPPHRAGETNGVNVSVSVDCAAIIEQLAA